MTLRMKAQLTDALFDDTEALSPFGIIVHAGTANRSPWDLEIEAIREEVQRHRVVVFRGFTPLPGDALTDFSRAFGNLLAWDFGYVLNLVVHATPTNYLFTAGNVPFHWDGAFAQAVPSLQIFQCLRAPDVGAGGETVFCDTVRVYADASEFEQREWERIVVTYTTDKVAHYGGRVTVPLLAEHPVSKERTLRFAEALDEDSVPLNPLFLQVEGMTAREQEHFCQALSQRLHRREFCYSHTWQTGDILLADNHALLHGRNPFLPGSPRHLQRVHVL